jgi:hypothetical protein
LLDLSVTAMLSTSQQKFARSHDGVAVGKAPNIFAPHFRSTLSTTHTHSLTAVCHREKRGDRYFRAAASALACEAADFVAIRPKEFGASPQLREFINGGIILH